MTAAGGDRSALPAPDPEPFDLEPAGAANGAAVLCIHGLTGTPWEVRGIGEEMVARGYRARGPLLPGHGDIEGPGGLAKRTYHDWVECTRREWRRLVKDHDEVCVVGMSLGGLLTLLLASEYPVAAAAVIGTPLRFRGAKPLAIAVGRFVKPMLVKTNGSDISDPRARAVHPGMTAMPLASVHELVKLQKLVRAQLARVKAPLFIGHGALDRTADPADVETIATGVGSREVVQRLYERSGHVVPVDLDRARVTNDVADFLTRKR